MVLFRPFVNKKVVPQDYHIPLALLWIHDKDEFYQKTIQEAGKPSSSLGTPPSVWHLAVTFFFY